MVGVVASGCRGRFRERGERACDGDVKEKTGFCILWILLLFLRTSDTFFIFIVVFSYLLFLNFNFKKEVN